MFLYWAGFYFETGWISKVPCSARSLLGRITMYKSRIESQSVHFLQVGVVRWQFGLKTVPVLDKSFVDASWCAACRCPRWCAFCKQILFFSHIYKIIHSWKTVITCASINFGVGLFVSLDNSGEQLNYLGHWRKQRVHKLTNYINLKIFA